MIRNGQDQLQIDKFRILTVQRPCRPEPALILRVFAFGPSLP